MQPVLTRNLTRLTGALAVAAALTVVVACGNRQGAGDASAPDAAPAKRAEGAPGEEGPCPGVEAADREKVVAQVGDVEITVCDVTEALNKMSPYLRKAYESPQKRQQFLDNMIRFELIAQEAERRGYASDEEVQRVRKQMMIQRLNKQLQESVRLSDITDEEMRAYYEEHEGDYHKAEMVRIARILCKTEGDCQRVLGLAKSKASDSRYFRQLARDHSVDEQTKEHGGDLPYFPRVEERQEGDPEVDPALVKVAFELDMREPLGNEIVKTADGWNVVRLRGRRKARDLSFDDVKRQIRHRLHRDKLREARDTLIAKLRKSSAIVVNEEELAKVRIDMPSDSPERPAEPLPADDRAPAERPRPTKAIAPAPDPEE
jgi:peptidyl-prolyl cis-trans isomerase C